MYSSTARVLAVLDLLEIHGRMRGEEIAERLAVDARTIRRYIMILRDRGIPVEMARGRYGGYYLQSGFKRQLTFTLYEALAITLDVVSQRQQCPALVHQESERALKKVLRVLPSHIREIVQHLDDTVTFAAPPTSDGGQGDPEHFARVLQAVQAHRRIFVRYRSWAGEVTERHFDPYQVVARHGVWYLVGYCHLRADQRVFRLDHIDSLMLLDERFTPPAIDALAQVEQAIARTAWRWHYLVRVDLPLAEARRRIPATIAELEEQENSVLMRGFADDLAWLAYVLIGLRCPLVILDPPELRAQLLTLAERIRTMAAS